MNARQKHLGDTFNFLNLFFMLLLYDLRTKVKDQASAYVWVYSIWHTLHTV